MPAIQQKFDACCMCVDDTIPAWSPLDMLFDKHGSLTFSVSLHSTSATGNEVGAQCERTGQVCCYSSGCKVFVNYNNSIYTLYRYVGDAP